MKDKEKCALCGATINDYSAHEVVICGKAVKVCYRCKDKVEDER